MAQPALSTGQGQGSATVLSGKPSTVETGYLGQAIGSGVNAFREGLKEKALKEEKAKQKKEELLKGLNPGEAQTEYYQKLLNEKFDEVLNLAETLPPEEFTKTMLNFKKESQNIRLSEKMILQSAKAAEENGLGVYDEQLGIYRDPLTYSIMQLGEDFEGDPTTILSKFEEKITFDPDLSNKILTEVKNLLATSGIEQVDITTDASGKQVITNTEQLPPDVLQSYQRGVANTTRGNSAATLSLALRRRGQAISPASTYALTDFTVESPLTGEEKTYASFEEYNNEAAQRYSPFKINKTVTNPVRDGGDDTKLSKLEVKQKVTPTKLADGVEVGGISKNVVPLGTRKNVRFTNNEGKDQDGFSNYATINDAGDLIIGIDTKDEDDNPITIEVPYSNVSDDLPPSLIRKAEKLLIESGAGLKTQGFTQEEVTKLDDDLSRLSRLTLNNTEETKKVIKKYFPESEFVVTDPSSGADIEIKDKNGNVIVAATDLEKEEDRAKVIAALSKYKGNQQTSPVKTTKPNKAQIDEFKRLRGAARLKWLNQNNFTIEDFEN